MAYYKPFDATLCQKLKWLNQAVNEELLTPHEALATARALDPLVYVCPVCGALGCGCDCTIQLDPKVIEEAIRNEQHETSR